MSSMSCSRVYYKPPTTGPVATVSFSNLSPELPDINIISNCKSLPIDRELIENKKPDEIAKYRTKIPANEAISIQYVYDWIIKERTELVFAGNSLIHSIDAQKRKYASSCVSLVSFTPEEGKHYEVYFGLVDEKCDIKVSELARTTGSMQTLHSLESTKVNECRK